MSNSRLVLVLVFVLILAGCAAARGPRGWYWERPNAALPEFERDSKACIAHATPAQNIEVYRACMRSKGWVRVRTRAEEGGFRGPEKVEEFQFPPPPRPGAPVK
jgi:hypothetical protein